MFTTGWVIVVKIKSRDTGKWDSYWPAGSSFPGDQDLDVYAPVPRVYRTRREAEKHIVNTDTVQRKVNRCRITWEELP
jgi:hypothetical protein